MSVRDIVKIDEEKCNGCGQCVTACAEGAIEIIDGKAKLISDIYCDGLGACLGHCPQDAITIEQRQADNFDKEAAKKHLMKKEKASKPNTGFTCPGTMAKKLRNTVSNEEKGSQDTPSQLSNWPVQLKLVSPLAPYFENSDLLLVADCVPFAMGNFHNTLLQDHSIAVGCPKLDDREYYIEKLTQILKNNQLKSLTIVHMEVPCCSGLVHIAKQAISNSGLNIPFKDITISLQGKIINEQ